MYFEKDIDKMNPSASEWKPSASAASWTPGQSFSVPTPAPAPAPAPPKEEEEDDIDETDPLWQAVLKISNGDKAAAKKMINDPDSLTKYPEIVALLGSDDMETDEPAVEEELAKEVETKMQIEEAPAPAPAPAPVEEVVEAEPAEPVQEALFK